MKLSAIVPCRTETVEIEWVLNSLLVVSPDHLHEILVIVAADATPGCMQAVESVRRRGENWRKITIILQEDKGCGAAYRLGIRHAQGDFIAFIEGDGEANPWALPRMIQAQLKTDADIVVAERETFIGYGKRKWLLNRTFNHVFGMLYASPCRDFTYSYKLLRSSIAKGIDWQCCRQDFNAESTIIPLALGAKYAAVKTMWRRRPGESQTSLKLGGNKIFLIPALQGLAIKVGIFPPERMASRVQSR